MNQVKRGGKKRGTKNLRTIELEQRADILGCCPFEILCHFAMGNWEALGYDSKERIVGYTKSGGEITKEYITPELRAHCAGEAAQYLHPKRKAIEVSGTNGGPIDVSISTTEMKTILKDENTFAALELIDKARYPESHIATLVEDVTKPDGVGADQG